MCTVWITNFSLFCNILIYSVNLSSVEIFSWPFCFKTHVLYVLASQLVTNLRLINYTLGSWKRPSLYGQPLYGTRHKVFCFIYLLPGLLTRHQFFRPSACTTRRSFSSNFRNAVLRSLMRHLKCNVFLFNSVNTLNALSYLQNKIYFLCLWYQRLLDMLHIIWINTEKAKSVFLLTL
jgi:hypothetical protein